MTFSDSIGAKTRGRKAAFLLLLFFGLLIGSSSDALACKAFGGLIDGFVDPDPPAQIQIDDNCTIRNFPASNPLTSNFSFFTQPGQTDERWLIIFDNVVHTGQMSCNEVQGHKIWFTNGSSTTIQEGCQNLLIPVEKIDKANPPGPASLVARCGRCWHGGHERHDRAGHAGEEELTATLAHLVRPDSLHIAAVRAFGDPTTAVVGDGDPHRPVVHHRRDPAVQRSRRAVLRLRPALHAAQPLGCSAPARRHVRRRAAAAHAGLRRDRRLNGSPANACRPPDPAARRSAG